MADQIIVLLSGGRKMIRENDDNGHTRYIFENMTMEDIAEATGAWVASKNTASDAWPNWMEKNR